MLAVTPQPRIFIVEQDAGRRFNRGQLLNYGTLLAMQAIADLTTVIFHDIDLVLEDRDGTCYGAAADFRTATHLAATFARYSSKSYIGGILKMHVADIVEVNGFPNSFWGWGGEDDALFRRITASPIGLVRPALAVADMERLTLDEKLQQLRAADAKCPDKRERLSADKYYRTRDGLNTLQKCPPRVLREYTFAEQAVTHTVVQLRAHQSEP